LNVLHIKDLRNGQIQFMWQRGNSLPIQYSHPILVSNPLSSEEREELRWYLEDYLTYPYGFEFRARKVEDKMTQWGESLFNTVFIKSQEDPDPRGMYQEAVREGLKNCELCISSDNPSFLNIPWELIRDPTPGRGYLAPLLGGLYRQRVSHRIEAYKSPYSDDQLFRILLVIARPKGEGDIPYGTVSRPLIEALRPLGPRIKLEVLRPPTFEALVEKLNDKPGYYNLVHFDGHGSFERGDPNGSSMKYGIMENCGCLVFEKEDGCHFVNSKDLGQALANAKVPLFVLNACQSAVEGENEAFSSVASQLIAVGAKGVVAMGYSVYASAATQFIQKFYENLIKGKSLSEVVAAGRLNLYSNAFRDSVVGKMEFRDWMVPTLYQQEQNYIPLPSGISSTNPPNLDPETQDLRQGAEEACPEGRFGFIGRDYDILRIERELTDDNKPWVLLSGMGGAGKTELAYGFARWYAETGGCDGGVFETSFKSKADFGQIVGSIVGHATDFSKYTSEEQLPILVRHLRENPCLLIWDNFESVSGYPQGSEPIATADELALLSRFLKSLRGGKSRVIITTRKENENWLGIAPGFVHISGLNYRDRAELAKIILSTIGKKPEDFRHDRNYGELLKLLNGHPRSLKVIIPLLKKKSPSEIIKALQHEVNDLGEKIEDASLSFAFLQLSPTTKKYLSFLGLFTSRVSPQILGIFVGNEGPGKAAYEEVVGRALSLEGWEAVLEEAATNGFVGSKDGIYYELHPTLPSFFRKQLVTDFGDNGLKILDAEFVNFYSALSYHFLEGIRNGEHSAKAFFAAEEPNFLRALRSAEINEDWESTDHIYRGILEFYENSVKIAESNALRMHLLSHIGLELTSKDNWEKASLWVRLLGDEADYHMSINRLKEAAAFHTQILNYLTSLENPAVEDNISVAYHQLGMIAQERQQFDEAKKWYRKALEINERLGLERDATTDYHQLGRVAEERQQFDEAEKWYRKALEIKERLGLERDAATDYHQLGIIAEERQQFDEAEKWYRKALEIEERLGLERDAATDYHQLGMIAEERQQFDEAEKWYRKALEIEERLEHPPLQVNTLAQLGVLCRGQNRFEEAVSYFGRALTIAASFKMNIGRQILVDLSRTMKVMGKEAFKESWVKEFGEQENVIELLEDVLRKMEEGDQ
jgi:tetratricopeptide (TPR) repeat protein